MAIAFIFLTLIFSYIIVSTFHLRRFGINLADIALPLFAVEIVLVSAKFYTHSFLPHYLLAMSILSLTLAIRQIRKRKTFSFRRFFKFFWRSGFVLTFFFYLATVIAAFLASWLSLHIKKQISTKMLICFSFILKVDKLIVQQFLLQLKPFVLLNCFAKLFEALFPQQVQ